MPGAGALVTVDGMIHAEPLATSMVTTSVAEITVLPMSAIDPDMALLSSL